MGQVELAIHSSGSGDTGRIIMFETDSESLEIRESFRQGYRVVDALISSQPVLGPGIWSSRMADHDGKAVPGLDRKAAQPTSL
jgi:hypothetical protein